MKRLLYFVSKTEKNVLLFSVTSHDEKKCNFYWYESCRGEVGPASDGRLLATFPDLCRPKSGLPSQLTLYAHCGARSSARYSISKIIFLYILCISR